MRNNLLILEQFFLLHSDLFQWVIPKRCCVGFPKLNIDTKIDMFAETLRQKTGIVILPGTVFDVQGNFFRVSFGKKNMPEVLNIFTDYINDL